MCAYKMLENEEYILEPDILLMSNSTRFNAKFKSLKTIK